MNNSAHLPGSMTDAVARLPAFLHDPSHKIDLVGFLKVGHSYPAAAPLMVSDAATREWAPWDGAAPIQGFTAYPVDLKNAPVNGGTVPTANVEHDVIVTAVFNPEAVNLSEADVTAPATPTLADLKTNLLASGFPLYPREVRS